MRTCGYCGGRVRQIHRTLLERFHSQAVYECRDCHRGQPVPRRFRYHFGPHSRCPLCGTYRLKRLESRDHIDPMYSGFLNLWERLAGGRLHHCCYCRIQFYDRRPLSAEAGRRVAAEPDVVKSDA